MPEWVDHQIVLYLTAIFDAIGWVGVLAIMALESANIPIPSEVTMPLAGWLLVQAKGQGPWTAVLVGGLIGAIGCTIGSVFSYGLGARGGRPFLERYGKYLMINPHDLDAADRWFGRWGDATAFFSRLLPIVRTFISFPAGVTRVRLAPFIVYTFVGSFLWCAALAYGGYAFGEHWTELRAAMRPFDIPIAIVLVGGFAYYIYHHIRRGMKARSPEESA
jgi:membrane protein DedA with SNARE-associated domain